MKTLSTYSLATLFLSFCLTITYAQSVNNGFTENSPIKHRKLYLHTDRDIYFQQDTVWFKAYYLDGQTHQFIPGRYSLYVSLIDKEGETIQRTIVPIYNSVAFGRIEIADLQEPGNYLLRAYTDFQKEIGEDVFFQKQLRISTVKRAQEIKRNKKQSKIDVDFLPEGGFLLEGLNNQVAVKAIDEKGQGIFVRGKVMNGRGELVTSFSTQYKGMDVISLKPLKDESYHVELEQYPKFDYEFDKIDEKGIKIEAVGETQNELSFRVLTNSFYYRGRTFHMAIMHRGQLNFYHKFVLTEKEFPVRIYKKALPPGINRLILLDEKLKPISERLYFSKQFETNEIKIHADKSSYKTRSEVQLNLFEASVKDDESFSVLSLSVVDQSAIGKNGPEMDILSWLLLDSELKGNIESPSDFFRNDDDLLSDKKLDFLMMTHGWSSYVWNSILEKEVNEIRELEGITISGKIKQNLTRKPVSKGDLLLYVYDSTFFISNETKTDKNGNFKIDNLLFYDTASFFVQARNKKGKLSTKILLDPIFKDDPSISKLYFPKDEINVGYSDSLHKKQYRKVTTLNDYLKDTEVIILKGVDVYGKKIDEDDGHFRIYNPSASLKLEHQDYAHRDVFDWMQGRFAGVLVKRGIGGNYVVNISGAMNMAGPVPAMLLLDGQQVDSRTIKSVPLSQIDKVEIIKAVDASIFGSRGMGCVVSVLTKRAYDVEYFNPIAPGTITEKILGYASYRKFYVPKYTASNIDSKKPDHRITLYWEPNIVLAEGKATLSFFTADDITAYKIIVEGMSSDGRICIGATDLLVEERSDPMNY